MAKEDFAFVLIFAAILQVVTGILVWVAKENTMRGSGIAHIMIAVILFMSILILQHVDYFAIGIILALLSFGIYALVVSKNNSTIARPLTIASHFLVCFLCIAAIINLLDPKINRVVPLNTRGALANVNRT